MRSLRNGHRNGQRLHGRCKLPRHGGHHRGDLRSLHGDSAWTGLDLPGLNVHLWRHGSDGLLHLHGGHDGHLHRLHGHRHTGCTGCASGRGARLAGARLKGSGTYDSRVLPRPGRHGGLSGGRWGRRRHRRRGNRRRHCPFRRRLKHLSELARLPVTRGRTGTRRHRRCLRRWLNWARRPRRSITPHDGRELTRRLLRHR